MKTTENNNSTIIRPGYYRGAKSAAEINGAELVFYTACFAHVRANANELTDEEKAKFVAVSGTVPSDAPEYVQRADVKNKKAMVLVPGWSEIVSHYKNDLKAGIAPEKVEATYIKRYFARLARCNDPREVIENGAILCCYDGTKAFCHRFLIGDWAENWGREHGIKIVYAGEYFSAYTPGGFFDKRDKGKKENFQPMNLFIDPEEVIATERTKAETVEEETKMETTENNTATDTAIVNAEIKAKTTENTEEEIKMENTNIIAIESEESNAAATDTAIVNTVKSKEEKTTVENKIEEEVKMANNNINNIEAAALEAAKAAAQAKNAYEKISREKKAVAELNKLFGAKKGVASVINQIANNSYKKAAAELAIANLGEVVVDYMTEKQVAAHNKKIATQKSKIAKAEEKIAIYREKLTAANNKLAAFNDAEIVAAALAVLGGNTVTVPVPVKVEVETPVVVEEPVVVETPAIDVDVVLSKVNAAVIAARTEILNDKMVKAATELKELSAAIDTKIAAAAAEEEKLNAELDEIEQERIESGEKIEKDEPADEIETVTGTVEEPTVETEPVTVVEPVCETTEEIEAPVKNMETVNSNPFMSFDIISSEDFENSDNFQTDNFQVDNIISSADFENSESNENFQTEEMISSEEFENSENSETEKEEEITDEDLAKVDLGLNTDGTPKNFGAWMEEHVYGTIEQPTEIVEDEDGFVDIPINNGGWTVNTVVTPKKVFKHDSFLNNAEWDEINFENAYNFGSEDCTNVDSIMNEIYGE